MLESFCILIEISVFFSGGPINNKPALVQVMPWCRIGAWTNIDQDNWLHMTLIGINELIALN